MRDFQTEIGAFKEARRAETARARQMVALQLACGVDLSEAQGNGPAVAARYAAKVRRLLERERIRGVRRHWSYDLNRHIALKEVLDDLLRAANPQTSAG